MIVIPEHRIREMKARGWWGDVTLDDLFLNAYSGAGDDNRTGDRR